MVFIFQTGFYIKAGNHKTFSKKSRSVNLEEYYAKNHGLSKDVLFVVKHSKGPNMVVYEAKKTAKKVLDHNKPVDVYWLMKTKGATTEALTLIEWKLAFGFKLKTLLTGKSYKITLNAIKNKDIFIFQDQQGRVEGYTKLNGVNTKLKEVFIKFEYSFLWPDVKYVEFKGIDLATGKLITQRFHKS